MKFVTALAVVCLLADIVSCAVYKPTIRKVEFGNDPPKGRKYIMIENYEPAGWTRARASAECERRQYHLGAIETDKIANAIIGSLTTLESERYSMLTGELYNKNVKKAQTPDGDFPEYQNFAQEPSSNGRDICFYNQANRKGLVAVPSNAPHKYVLCEFKAE